MKQSRFVFQSILLLSMVVFSAAFALAQDESSTEITGYYQQYRNFSFKLGGVSTEKMILCLVPVEYGNRRQNAESVGREVNDLGGVPGFGWQHDFIDIVNGIGYPGVFRNGAVRKINAAILLYGNIFK